VFPIRNAVATRYPPIATWTLIAINCVVFLVQIGLSPSEQEAFVSTYALIPARYFALGGFDSTEDLLPFVTMMFLHGGWLHLILNMWTLWLFGGVVEDRLGSGRYVAFYLTCGIAAAIAHAAVNPTSTVPALGASGAIAGVMGCYMRLFPWARVIVVIPIIFIPLFFELPAVVFVGLWFILQLLQGTIDLLSTFTGAGVAWWAHVGGFLVGFAIGPLLVRSERAYRTYFADEGIYGFTPMGSR
jgi:membrane associated rhomboid family serine protease